MGLQFISKQLSQSYFHVISRLVQFNKGDIGIDLRLLFRDPVDQDRNLKLTKYLVTDLNGSSLLQLPLRVGYRLHSFFLGFRTNTSTYLLIIYLDMSTSNKWGSFVLVIKS